MFSVEEFQFICLKILQHSHFHLSIHGMTLCLNLKGTILKGNSVWTEMNGPKKQQKAKPKKAICLN